MAGFFKVNYTEEEKIAMVAKALTWRKKYGLTLEACRQRLGLKQQSHLSKLIKRYKKQAEKLIQKEETYNAN